MERQPIADRVRVCVATVTQTPEGAGRDARKNPQAAVAQTIAKSKNQDSGMKVFFSKTDGGSVEASARGDNSADNRGIG